MSAPLRLAFLGCGFITGVHSRHLKALRSDIVCSYASRDKARADAFCREWKGENAYASYEAAIEDPRIDAVLVAVPPRFHLDLTLRALAAGKHVLVEKPAFPCMVDFETAIAARDRARRVVIVGENDHYKPQAVRLRKLISEGAVGDVVFAYLTTIARRLKTSDDWRNDETMAGGDAFFEEGIHWLHLAGSLGPAITHIRGFRPAPQGTGPDRRAKSMLVAFDYDNGAVGTLLYSREVPSLFKGLRLSKLFGRRGVISFESNGTLVLTRGDGLPRLTCPGLRDIRGYRAMYRDFAAAIASGRPPEMSLERAAADHRLMAEVYGNLAS
jgi:predicted dehydrogenase